MDGAAGDRPLFIPLRAEWFEAFAEGRKREEFRPYNARWNERSCPVGRPVVLSCGYGAKRRLRGVIEGFRVAGPDATPTLRSIYPTGDRFSAIAIRVIGP